MKDILKPLHSDSLVDVFISRFEDLILTGKIAIGQKLPSERELALQLGVSRPVVHEGLVDLAAKGLVTMKPRIGTVVNDYRKEGSLAILNSIINYQQGAIDEGLLESLLQIRLLVESETSRLAAANRTEDHLRELREILEKEESAGPRECKEDHRTRLQVPPYHRHGIRKRHLPPAHQLVQAGIHELHRRVLFRPCQCAGHNSLPWQARGCHCKEERRAGGERHDRDIEPRRRAFAHNPQPAQKEGAMSAQAALSVRRSRNRRTSHRA